MICVLSSFIQQRTGSVQQKRRSIASKCEAAGTLMYISIEYVGIRISVAGESEHSENVTNLDTYNGNKIGPKTDPCAKLRSRTFAYTVSSELIGFCF